MEEQNRLEQAEELLQKIQGAEERLGGVQAAVLELKKLRDELGELNEEVKSAYAYRFIRRIDEAVERGLEQIKSSAESAVEAALQRVSDLRHEEEEILGRLEKLRGMEARAAEAVEAAARIEAAMDRLSQVGDSLPAIEQRIQAAEEKERHLVELLKQRASTIRGGRVRNQAQL